MKPLPKQERELTRLTRHFSVNEKSLFLSIGKKSRDCYLKIFYNFKCKNSRYSTKFLKTYKPKRVLIVLVGLILGVIVGLAYAFLREFFNNTIKNTEEIEKYSSIPIYGVIPFNKNKKLFLFFLKRI